MILGLSCIQLTLGKRSKRAIIARKPSKREKNEKTLILYITYKYHIYYYRVWCRWQTKRFFFLLRQARAIGDHPLGAPADVAEELLAIAGERNIISKKNRSASPSPNRSIADAVFRSSGVRVYTARDSRTKLQK